MAHKLITSSIGGAASLNALRETLDAVELAKRWATNPEDEIVQSGQYSAFHWAAKAQDSFAFKADLVGGKVPASQLPSYVDAVEPYANLAAFPAIGSTEVIYIALDTDISYRWSGSAYFPVNPGNDLTDHIAAADPHPQYNARLLSGLEISQSNTGDRGSFVDFHSSGTPGANDYSARIIRDVGVNGNFNLTQTGTGSINFSGGGSLIRTGDFEVTETTTLNYLKWSRAIPLAASVDLNGIVQPGFYEVVPDPVNAPHAAFGFGYLTVEGHSNLLSPYAIQRLNRFTVNGAVTWARVLEFGTWRPWKPVSGFATPEHYGGAGATTTGASTNNNVALQRWLDSDSPLLLDQFYTVDNADLLAFCTGRAGFTLSGRGGRCGLILQGGSSITVSQLDQDNPTGYNADLVTVSDVNIFTNQNTADIPLSISFLDGDSGSQVPGIDLRNVHIIAADTSGGSTDAQLQLYNVRQGSLSNVSVAGKYFSYASDGIRFASGEGSAPVEVSCNNVRAAHCAQGFRIVPGGSVPNDDMQGYHFSASTALAVNRGFDISGGPEGFGEWFTMERCHANFREVGILGTNAGNMHVTNCYLLAHGDLATSQAVAITGNTILNAVEINNNIIIMSAATGATRNGINTPAAWIGHVGGNKCTGATNAFGLIGAGQTTSNNSTF